MLKVVFRAVLIGFPLLFTSCSNYPEPLFCKDMISISKPLSAILKNEYGLYVTVHTKVSSTDDFFNYKLLLFGDTEGHLDWHIVALGMGTTHNFLFNEVIFIDSSSDVNCPAKDAPCVTKKDTVVSCDYKKLPRTRNTYSNSANLNKIFKRNLNSTDCVFVMEKSNSKRFSKRLKELIVK